jgi:hypothetical protein
VVEEVNNNSPQGIYATRYKKVDVARSFVASKSKYP